MSSKKDGLSGVGCWAGRSVAIKHKPVIIKKITN
jgi:hypothetical protein